MKEVVLWIGVFLCVCVGLIALAIFGLWLLTVVWAWIVPDVFSGMVTWGLLPAAITVAQAAKLAILLMALGLTGRFSVSGSKK